MSIWGTVAGAGVAVVADMVIKFSPDEYQTKIDLLDGYAKKLEGHLETLEKYKSEISDFWKDDQAAEYEIVITDQITQVRKQQIRVEELKLAFMGVKDDLSGTHQVVQTIVSTAQSVLSGMGD